MEEAIKKINDEMQKDPKNYLMEILGHYLIDRATAEPMVAEAIMESKCTLKGAVAEVTKAAQKKKNGNMAMLTHMDVFGAVDNYFGLTPNHAAMYKSLGVDMTAMAAAQEEVPVGSYDTKQAAAAPRPIVLQGGKAKKSRVDIDLDDFF